MPNTREKLIELLNEAEEYEVNTCMFHSECEDCPGRKYGDNCRDCLKADHLIANGVTIQKWIPVAERLPKEYEPVLVYNPSVGHGQYVMKATLADDGWMTEFDFDPHGNPEITHWMPLPEPPKGE